MRATRTVRAPRLVLSLALALGLVLMVLSPASAAPPEGRGPASAAPHEGRGPDANASETAHANANGSRAGGPARSPRGGATTPPASDDTREDGPSDPVAPEEGVEVKVMSFNMAHGRGLDGALDLERIAQEIEASGVDVVGLQEVDQRYGLRSGYVDQPAWLAERLGMEVVFGENLTSVTGGYGNAILSAHPITSSTHHRLPRLDGEPRGLLEAAIEVGDTPLRILTTHLANRAPDERALQLDVILEHLGDAERTILTGDFNALPLGGELDDLWAVLDDGWATANPTNGRNRGGGETYPAGQPSQRIDYVAVSPDLRPERVVTVPTIASDHLPVVAEVAG
jgi:endonuclease/exonuclease/phosphatase family metal-dependent hydrolase